MYQTVRTRRTQDEKGVPLNSTIFQKTWFRNLPRWFLLFLQTSAENQTAEANLMLCILNYMERSID